MIALGNEVTRTNVKEETGEESKEETKCFFRESKKQC
jgi:hypothetical protein